MWWGGFSEELISANRMLDEIVLIPMWWGGFSEIEFRGTYTGSNIVLIPMWWGGFSEAEMNASNINQLGLNPHVVGRFFRAYTRLSYLPSLVLIPMWWGGFSEPFILGASHQMKSLNPHVVGRFFRERRGVFSIKFIRLKWSISKLQIFTKINGD